MIGTFQSRILVVEDNEGDVFLIEKALEDYGISAAVTVCKDGETAVKLLCADPPLVPDAIVLDLNLPRVEGMSVLHKVLSRPALVGVPVLIFTSSRSTGDRRRAEILGVTRYVRKPSTLDDFLHEVGWNVKDMLDRPKTATGSGSGGSY